MIVCYVCRPWRFLDCIESGTFDSSSESEISNSSSEVNSSSSSDINESESDDDDYSSSSFLSESESSEGDDVIVAAGNDFGDEYESKSSGSSDKLGCNNDGTGYVLCRVLNGVPCHGDRTFVAYDSNGRWCQSHTRARGVKSFPQAVVLSVLLGWCGADRIYMGYVGVGILKLFTLGGVGVWWLIDIVLICTGALQPSGYLWDNWIPDTKT